MPFKRDYEFFETQMVVNHTTVDKVSTLSIDGDGDLTIELYEADKLIISVIHRDMFIQFLKNNKIIC